MSVICGRSVVFTGSFGFLHQKNWPPWYSWNIVESGVKRDNPNLNPDIANNPYRMVRSGSEFYNNINLRFPPPIKHTHKGKKKKTTKKQQPKTKQKTETKKKQSKKNKNNNNKIKHRMWEPIVWNSKNFREFKSPRYVIMMLLNKNRNVEQKSWDRYVMNMWLI